MTTLGFALLGLLFGLSLLVQAGDAPMVYADSAPVLSAKKSHVHVVLTATHPTATDFTIRVLCQDEGITQPSEGLISNAQWHRIGQSQFVCRIKIQCDTNDFSVAPKGTTNWSKPVPIIP